MSLHSYQYASQVLLYAAAIIFLVFGIMHLSPFLFKVNYTQALLTLSISLVILAYIAYHGFEQKELGSWLFYGTFITGIPLLYHLFYLAFFSKDPHTKMKITKIYILGGVMIYLSLIWSNANRLVISEMSGNKMWDAFRMLTYIY
uniref:Uncharacterized protein n=1 Tax=viral metagenome TaxID=1070528 RepID=A0A6C0KTK1_9ZZZZ